MCMFISNSQTPHRVIKGFSLVSPRITPFSFEDSPVQSGQFIQVSCSVTEGDLPVKIEWLLNAATLEDFPEVSTATIGKRGSILAIESVSYTHAGNYTCRAGNKAGQETYTAELQVNGYG